MFRSAFWFLLVIVNIQGCDLPPKTAESNQPNIQPDSVEIGTTISTRFPVPKGYVREHAEPSTFAHYLQAFPLYPPERQVFYYDGNLKSNQMHHAAVLDIDVGDKDLQQCADAIMRLRAEFLYEQREFGRINFHFVSGFLARFDKWTTGHRIMVDGNNVSWYKTNREGSDRKSFHAFLETVFIYSGTISLENELVKKDLQDLSIGDVFIQGGSPGHAVLIMDVAKNPSTQDKMFLLAQSYMPAQDIHILKNEVNKEDSPWYSIDEIDEHLSTPEWTFNRHDLKYFP